MSDNILEIRDLEVAYSIYGGIFSRKINEVKGIDKINLDVERGKILGLVGESGCGKTTLGKTIVNILNVSARNSEVKGEINLLKNNKKTNLVSLNNKDLLSYRKNIQMIFQDPFSSLNPRIIVRDIIKEPLDIHYPKMSEKEKTNKVMNLLERVGLSREQAFRYPHEFSGGQRQRIGIARALATNPDIIVADEPVSALDVSIQAQVINLLKELQKEFNLTLIFIAHDLSVVEHISDNIAVMYLGDLVEHGEAHKVYYESKHPYTKSLISSVPIPDPAKRNRKRIKLRGEIPSAASKPSGCPFRLRCPIAREECSITKPKMTKLNKQEFACHFYQDWDEKFKDL